MLSYVLALQATLGRAVPVVLKKPIVVLKDNRDNKGQQCHAVCISESYQLIFCILLKQVVWSQKSYRNICRLITFLLPLHRQKNASLLRQYACGLKSPTKATVDKIRAAIDNYKKDIAAGLLIDRPVHQYI